MKTILIFLLFYFNLGFSQDLKKYQKLDTVYIKFKERHYYQKKIQMKFSQDIMYYFYGANIQGKPTTILKRKSFLRKHKEEIIDMTDKKNDGLYLSGFFQEKHRIYYIIDVDDFVGRKIQLRETHNPYFYNED